MGDFLPMTILVPPFLSCWSCQRWVLLIPAWFPWALYGASVMCKRYSDGLLEVCYAVGYKGKATVTCLRSEVTPEG